MENIQYMLLLLPLLIISILLEGTVTTLPLILICLLLLMIIKRDGSVFPVAFFAGLFLDAMTLHRMGGASIFFLVFVFLIFLYQKKYEIYSYPFVFAASFFGGWAFLAIFGYHGVIQQALCSSIIAVLLLVILKILAIRK